MVIIPITTYGSEIWIMSEDDISNLYSFQRYAGLQFQHFGQRSHSFSAYYGPGWIGITNYICIMFALMIVPMNDDSTIKTLFKQRATDFNSNIQKCMGFMGLYKDLITLLFARKCTKTQWKQQVWKTAEDAEDVYWNNLINLQQSCKYLYETTILGTSLGGI